MARTEWYINDVSNKDIEMYSVVDETFFKTLKNRLYKYMISISKNMYIDKLQDINTTIHIIEQLKWSLLM